VELLLHNVQLIEDVQVTDIFVVELEQLDLLNFVIVVLLPYQLNDQNFE
jgi:hypothetical protein